MLILHVAAISLSKTGGMARISSYWKEAFENAGHEFMHIGPAEVQPKKHYSLFGWEARQYIRANNLKPDLVLAHEPTSGFLSFPGVPLVVFSHGVEERAWQLNKVQHFFPTTKKSELLPEVIRFYAHRRGFRKAALSLLSNEADKKYLAEQKGITKTFVFTNGYNQYDIQTPPATNGTLSFLFNATWIRRKGTELVREAFSALLSKHPHTRLILAGTGASEEEVLKNFPQELHGQVTVMPRFDESGEKKLYEQAEIFVLPSYFEGQSLALTQAMAAGLCPIVSDNCGQADLVKHQENGLVFRTGEAGKFLEQVKWAVQHPEAAKALGQRAKARVLPYTWEKVSNEVVEKCLETTR
jgi:glycosyltransferase involved in cell wall biosynthesis